MVTNKARHDFSLGWYYILRFLKYVAFVCAHSVYKEVCIKTKNKLSSIKNEWHLSAECEGMRHIHQYYMESIEPVGSRYGAGRHSCNCILHGQERDPMAGAEDTLRNCRNLKSDWTLNPPFVESFGFILASPLSVFGWWTFPLVGYSMSQYAGQAIIKKRFCISPNNLSYVDV